MAKPGKQLDREIVGALEKSYGKSKALRRLAGETNTTEDGPGMGPPNFGDLGVGRGSDSHKSLFWTRLATEYKKESALRDRNSESALRVRLVVEHAPDDRTPFAQIDWGDPMDVRGAMAFARKLIEDSGERYSYVKAEVSRPSMKRRSVYNLTGFERKRNDGHDG